MFVLKGEHCCVYLRTRAILYKIKRKKRKKNGAHTHVRTTVQLSEHNIHVGCCLFSHDTKTNSTKKKQVVSKLKKMLLVFWWSLKYNILNSRAIVAFNKIVRSTCYL